MSVCAGLMSVPSCVDGLSLSYSPSLELDALNHQSSL